VPYTHGMRMGDDTACGAGKSSILVNTRLGGWIRLAALQQLIVPLDLAGY